MMNSRNLNDLEPVAREVCNRHVALCHQAGIELIVTSTWRDFESQAALYDIGRNGDPRRTVTNAKPGQSWHNFKAAWDVVPLVHGKPVWDAADPLWKEVIAIGIEAGAEAGAHWKTFPDLPHFQALPQLDGKSIDLETAMERFRDVGTIFR